MNNEEKRLSVNMFFMGVMLGVFGSLAANALDRQFVSRFGNAYDFVVATFFLISIWWMEKKITKLLK